MTKFKKLKSSKTTTYLERSGSRCSEPLSYDSDRSESLQERRRVRFGIWKIPLTTSFFSHTVSVYPSPRCFSMVFLNCGSVALIAGPDCPCSMLPRSTGCSMPSRLSARRQRLDAFFRAQVPSGSRVGWRRDLPGSLDPPQRHSRDVMTSSRAAEDYRFKNTGGSTSTHTHTRLT